MRISDWSSYVCSSDLDPQRPGRIFSFDVAGDRHEEHGGFQAIGSGSVFAKSAIKKLYRHDLTGSQATKIAVESLYDAARAEESRVGKEWFGSFRFRWAPDPSTNN